MSAKIPPQNMEAEVSILGGLMLDPGCWDQIADLVEEGDFYRPAHQKIFSSIKELNLKNQAVDLITVTNLLQSRGDLDQVGGYAYLSEVIDKTVSSVHIDSYSQIVRSKSLLRRLISIGNEMVNKAYDEDFVDLATFLDQSEEKIFKLSEDKKSEGLVKAFEVVKTSVKKIEDLFHLKGTITGISSGFRALDEMTMGLHPGELTIIAARPSMGKTAFSLNIAQHIALRMKKTVAFFSLEMPKDSVMIRLLASEANLSIGDVRSGRIPESAWPNLISAAAHISDCPFYIDDTHGISPFEIRSKVRRLKSQYGLDLIVIDYLQLMDLKQKVENRERAVSEISRGLKAISKELNIPVIALAQLNRGVEGRTEKRPMLSDLRESGSIEQDADVILLLYREDYYDKEDPQKQGQAEVIIGKQRNGPTGIIKLRWEARFGRFVDQQN